MEFTNQKQALEDLKIYAEQDKHSLIIEGPSGSGKTYLTKQYANLLKVEDYKIIEPKVKELRQALDDCLYIETDILLCIENLDDVNLSSASVLLKSMEEPQHNMYFIITCRDSNKIPDTLVSRSMLTTVNPPTSKDLQQYMNEKYSNNSITKNNQLMDCICSFSDIDYVANMSKDQEEYFNNFKSSSFFNDTIASISWNLGHYKDKSEIPIELVIRFIMNCNKTSSHILRACIDCLNELSKKRIAKHIVLSKFAFELKYCE